MKTTSFIATGDSFITRRLPENINEKQKELFDLINSADFKFTNFEVTAHYYEGYPSAVPGGTWAIADPLVLKDIKRYGFNVLAWANNHTMDYSYGGLEATTKYIEENGFIHAGVGKNLAEASSPKYLETANGRVALISASSTFHEYWVPGMQTPHYTASEQRGDMIGRPGLNPIRYDTKYVISEEKMNALKEIITATDINKEMDVAAKEGFAKSGDDKTLKMGAYEFSEGLSEGAYTKIHEMDRQRILKSISEAKRQARYVMVSIHAHEMGDNKAEPPEFLKVFARECIDEGADAIIGHGPHIIRGIELYKNKPIFYSLGNFIFQNETVDKLPEDFYIKYGLDHDANIADAFDKRNNGGKKGLITDYRVWESVIAKWIMEDGAIKEIQLHPIDLGFGKPRHEQGWPLLTENTNVIKELKELSEEFGTEIEIKNGTGLLKL